METRDVSPPIWREDIRLDYPLTAASVVVDAGVYEGLFSHQISSKFGCRVIGLEPVSVFFNQCKARFEGNPKVEILNLGIGAQRSECEIFINKDASSCFVKAEQKETAKFLPLSEIMEMAKIDSIDLIKINIEGAEFEVLENIISTGLISKIRFIQVQFHQTPEGTVERLAAIRAALDKTHHCSWIWPPMTWESWERRSAKEESPK